MEKKEDRITIENDELISDIIERNYYNDFEKENGEKNIELIINRCNTVSKCYGCFNNTEKLMYPHIDFTQNDYNKIFNNLSTFLKFYGQKDWKCPIKLTGIDWTNDEVCGKVLQLFSSLQTRVTYNFPKKIIIDTDLECLINKEKDLFIRWSRCFEFFRKSGINIFFNIYANGPYCDDNNHNVEYYKELIEWINSYHINERGFKIIAYIRPTNVKNWIKNYDWWIQNSNFALHKIELREEKTDKWTDELISEYILFLKHQIEYFSSIYNKEDLKNIIFNQNKEIIFQNISLLENKYLINERKNNNCDFFKNLTIDLTTMNIVPCAKINYEDFACGQYIIEDNKITGIKSKNVPIVIFNTHLKQSCMPHCEDCEHIEFCSGHCLGESYNKCYDMLCPIKEFCNLSKAKINFLIYVYTTMELLSEETMTKMNCNKLYIKSILSLQKIIKEVL